MTDLLRVNGTRLTASGELVRSGSGDPIAPRRMLDASVTAAIPVDALQKLLKQCKLLQ